MVKCPSYAAGRRLTWLVLVLGFTLQLSSAAWSKTIELTFWHGFGGASEQKLNELVDRFNQSHPGIKVSSALMTAGVPDKLLAATAAGTAPDIFWQTGAMIEPLEAYLLPLDKFIDQEPGFRKDFFPGLWVDAIWNGITYGVPFEHASVGLALYLPLLQSAGLKENGPQTWDELRTYARKTTNAQSGIFGLNFDLGNLSWAAGVNFGSFLHTNKGTFMTPDEKQPTWLAPEFIETMDYLYNLIAVDGTSSVQTQAITSGKTAIMTTLPARILGLEATSVMEGTIGTAMIPARKQRGGINTSKELFITKSDPEREKASWEFVKWLVSTEVNFEWNCLTLGYLPTRQSVVRMKAFQNWMREHPLIQPWVEQAEFVTSRPRSKQWNSVSSYLFDAFKKSVIDKSTDPRTALEEATRTALAKIAEIK